MLRRMSRRILGTLRRVTGVSTPVGGVSWTPSVSERDALRKLIVFLEDRRALFDPYNVEATALVHQSVQEIRGELTKVLRAIGESSRADEPLRTMRAACQRYLTRAVSFTEQPHWHRPPRFHSGFGDDGDGDDFILALGELRGAFAACIHQIASAYDIEVHGQLAAILPANTDSAATWRPGDA